MTAVALAVGPRTNKATSAIRSLNWLPDRLSEVYEDAGSRYFVDVWAARDEYIGVMRDRASC